MTEETNALPTGYSLHRYQIEGVLGAGGFGITYRALHEALENEVAIKEYFPAEWAYRDHDGTTVRPNAQGQIPARDGEPACYTWGLQRFLDEAKILVQINHPGVVRVRDYFTANGSAYIVMEYEEGESLSAALQRGGILPEQELRRMLEDVIPALEAVHAQGYLHRDLKPSNLYIRSSDGHMMLIDFGAARQALGRRSRTVTSVVTPGYSPIEQYVTVGEDYGPWTDIYALGAVLYRCITGATPVEAPGRVLKDPVQPAVEVGAGLYSRALLQVVDRALAVRPEDRFQSVATMREVLLAAGQSSDTPDFSQVPPIRPELLELSPSAGIPRLELAPDDLGAPSPSSAVRDEWFGGDAWQSERRRQAALPQIPDQPSFPSRPPRRVDQPLQFEPNSSPFPRPPSSPGANQFDWAFDTGEPRGRARTADAIAAPKPMQAADADLSLPMLENIWEQMDEAAPRPVSPSPESAFGTGPAPQPRSEPSEPLLRRSTQSAVEHLRKASVVKREKISSPHFPQPESPASLQTPPGHEEIGISEQFQPAVEPAPGSLAVNWTRRLLPVFAISVACGLGLLGYQYYQSIDEQNQREAAELQRRQEQQAAGHTQEESQQRETEIRANLEQARASIAAKDWDRARIYLDRAAALSPDHPAVAAAESELLAAQRPGFNTKTFTDNTTGLELKWVQGGCFTMGSPATEQDHGNDEPSHQVCVKGFWMGKTEITNSQFQRFKPGHDSGSVQGRPLNGNDQPAVNLNWEDAAAFAEWLSWEAGAGKRFRLPTEAEWEYAARAGATTRYAWGNDIDPRHANFSDRNDPTGASIGNLDDGHSVTAPVGSYLPNILGLHDMAGNVWEWTCSEYNPNYGGEEQRCSTRRPTEGQRVVRGGSWNNGPAELRSAVRLPRKPDYRDATTGFRLVMEE
jgi:formylglycine-generating enzyme required for sulfatase activity/serine/threonine protein kinase